MKRFFVNQTATLKEFTDVTYAQASMCLRTLLKNREVRVNGVKVGENVLLKAGDEVCYYLTPAQEAKRAFAVVYEDEQVIVVDKESGVSSEAVFSALTSETGHSEHSEESPNTQFVYFVHRLDRNTEGLMIFGKTEAAYGELLACFRDRRAEKVYHALVIGKMPKLHDVLTAYLQKDDAHSRVRIFRQADAKSEKIITEYEVLEDRGEVSLLKVTLHTGKTHQIRAHLAYVGHPVVGDEKYGDSAFNRKLHATRQRLLSKELTLKVRGALAYLSGKTFTSEKYL